MNQPEALVLSVVIEALVAPLVAARVVAPGGRRRAALGAAGAAIAGTLLTHAAVWHGALALYPRLGVAPTLAIVELGAVLVEAALYAVVLSPGRALAVSLAANAGSAALGAWLAW